MKRLEPVYLANVILYVDSIETIVKLIQVNKKCQEATKIIRYYNKRKLYESGDCSDHVVISNLFDLFPNVETIECCEEDIVNNIDLFESVNQIELNIASYYTVTNINLHQEIKEKVTKLRFTCFSLKNIRLNEFPNVRKVELNYSFGDYLKGLLGNTNIKLSQLVLKTNDTEELDCLKNYINIENIIIKIENKITMERYQELNSFAKVYSQHPIAGIDVINTFYLFGFPLISNEPEINKIYDLTLFKKCHVENNANLSYFKLLEEVTCFNDKRSQCVIQIEGLKHLKRIENIRKVDCIPSSVTYLSINPLFNYKELVEKDNNCFDNLREIRFEIDIGNNVDFNLLTNFKNCTKLELVNEESINGSFGLPISIKELIISYFYNENQMNENQMNEIAKLTGLKKLTFHTSKHNNNQMFQKVIDSLKELESLNMYGINDITLPSTLSSLTITLYKKTTDLSQHRNLKVIVIESNGVEEKEITLPNNLNKLSIFGNVIVTNSNEIEIGSVFFHNTQSQFLQWNSKKQIVIVKFKK